MNNEISNCGTELVIFCRYELTAVTVMYYNLPQKRCQQPIDVESCNCEDRLVINGLATCGQMSRPDTKVYIGADIGVDIQLMISSDKLNKNEGFYLQYIG